MLSTMWPLFAVSMIILTINSVGCQEEFGLEGLIPSSLNVSKVTIESLINGDKKSETTINREINELMLRLVKGQKVSINVDKGDIAFSSSFPDKEFSNSCSKRIHAYNPRVKGSLLRSSVLTTNVASTDNGLSAFLQADLDAEVDLDFRFRAEVGARIFRKCRRLFRETLDLALKTSGNVEIQVSLAGKNVRYVEEDNKFLMKFDLDLVLNGRPYGWNVDNIDVSGCDIKLGGRIKVGSYCSLIRNLLKSGLNKYLDKWTRFEAPKLIEKLESKLQKKIGDEVVIKLIEF